MLGCSRSIVAILGSSRLEILHLALGGGAQTSARCFATRPTWFLASTTLQTPAVRANLPSIAVLSQVSQFSTSSCLETENKKFKDDVDKQVETIRCGLSSQKVPHPDNLVHFRAPKKAQVKLDNKGEPIIGTSALPHPIWNEEALHSVHITHMEPNSLNDRMAYRSVRLLRRSYDLMSGYEWRPRTEKVWLNRMIFLETVAGVPGMVAAMVRHLHSLRRMRRDHGWIHTLLEEAENERMHLMTAMQLKKPSFFFRWSVIVTQAVFVGAFSLAYMVSPRFCHRFVGYLEEEAVVTYTKLLKDIDGGLMQHWDKQAAPLLAITYWQLPQHGTMKDVILAIRADEAHHRVVNHTLGSMQRDDYNPYKPGQ